MKLYHFLRVSITNLLLLKTGEGGGVDEDDDTNYLG